MIRLLAAASFAALLLAACTPKVAAPDAAPDAVTETASIAPAAPAAPDGFQLSFLEETETYTAQSEIDPAILAFDPALAYRFWTANTGAFKDLAAQAAEGRVFAEEFAQESGETPAFLGYSLSITQKATLILGDVISVEDNTDTYTGGAHPNYFLGGEIYRKGAADPLALSAFVTDEAAFNELVIKSLTAAKLANGFDSDAAMIEASVRELLVPTPEVPDLYKGKFVLSPSTEPGKAGGITVLFSPYDVGSYAEGSYTAIIPASSLAPILKPEWASQFGGAPLETRTSDPT